MSGIRRMLLCLSQGRRAWSQREEIAPPPGAAPAIYSSSFRGSRTSDSTLPLSRPSCAFGTSLKSLRTSLKSKEKAEDQRFDLSSWVSPGNRRALWSRCLQRPSLMGPVPTQRPTGHRRTSDLSREGVGGRCRPW